MLAVEDKKKSIVILVVIILVIIIGKTIFLADKEQVRPKEAEVLNKLSDSKWDKVGNLVIPDIVAMNFDESGQYGVVVSLGGQIAKSLDGGESWKPSGIMPINLGELVNGVAISSSGRATVATSVDDSAYTGIYQENANGSWERTICKDCGGILALDNDGKIGVGGGGLISKFDSQLNKWQFSYLPSWGAYTLYGVASSGQKLWVSGENGLLALSQDQGNSWINLSPSSLSSLPFYSITCSESGDKVLLGGVNGSLLMLDTKLINQNSNSNNNGDDFGADNNSEINNNSNSSWIEVKGLDREMIINSVLLTNRVLLASGGKLTGLNGFIISSKDGNTWNYDLLPKDISSIVSLKVSRNQLFAASSDGNILKRVKTQL